MNLVETTYLIPYFVSLLLSLAILYYVWEKRRAQGALAFGWYVLGQFLWISGFILELISPDLEDKIFWDGFQWLSANLILIALPVFAVQFTEYRLRNPRLAFAASLFAPAVFTLLLITDGFHHWIYGSSTLLGTHPFAELAYDPALAVYGYALYSYAIMAWGLSILFRRLIRPHGLYRAQLLVILLGFSIPIAGTVFTLLGVKIAPERDAYPFLAALGNIIIAWGLFRFRIFEVVPIGREKVFEALADPVVILDKQNLIVDINQAMLALLDRKANDVIGQSAKKVFDNFPIPIKMYTQVSYARTEACFELNKKQIYYELTVWPIYNSSKEMVGRVYISHDITALKELEGELRKLNLKLEDRVQERTRELEEAYESMLEGFARALELRDKETEGHSRRVTEHTLKIAQKIGIRGEALEDIRSGSILHDIGKISIPDEILHKKGRLTPEERAIIQQHPETAYKLLSRIPFLSKAVEIPYCHHEKWDGTGYPRGLKGGEIPLSARIFAVADVWDALSHDRPYNKAWSREQIIAYFNEQSGRHFDPGIVRVFLAMVEKGEI
ncbi:MAG: hypothetical protein DPW18_11940 [Chloroflexi bacterium]|nr:hypothetical protein [Chloroflexota bacterium]MDL1942523.1 HD domain-containing protein [Chloroflexi bacterium CFX2]